MRSKILRQIMILLGLLNTNNANKSTFFENKNHYFYLIFKNLNCRKPKEYEQDYIQTDITSLNIACKKVIDSKCRKTSIKSKYKTTKTSFLDQLTYKYCKLFIEVTKKINEQTSKTEHIGLTALEIFVLFFIEKTASF